MVIYYRHIIHPFYQVVLQRDPVLVGGSSHERGVEGSPSHGTRLIAQERTITDYAMLECDLVLADES